MNFVKYLYLPKALSSLYLYDSRELLNNGSLYIPPFPPEQFTSAIHASVYRCEASNAVGSILSRNVKLKPGKNQKNILLSINFVRQVVS